MRQQPRHEAPYVELTSRFNRMFSSSIGRAVSCVLVVEDAGAFVLALLPVLAGSEVFGIPLGLSVIGDLTAEGDDLFALRLGLATASLLLPSSTDKAAKALLLVNRDMALEPIYRMTSPDTQWVLTAL